MDTRTLSRIYTHAQTHTPKHQPTNDTGDSSASGIDSLLQASASGKRKRRNAELSKKGDGRKNEKTGSDGTEMSRYDGLHGALLAEECTDGDSNDASVFAVAGKRKVVGDAESHAKDKRAKDHDAGSNPGRHTVKRKQSDAGSEQSQGLRRNKRRLREDAAALEEQVGKDDATDDKTVNVDATGARRRHSDGVSSSSSGSESKVEGSRDGDDEEMSEEDEAKVGPEAGSDSEEEEEDATSRDRSKSQRDGADEGDGDSDGSEFEVLSESSGGSVAEGAGDRDGEDDEEVSDEEE